MQEDLGGSRRTRSATPECCSNQTQSAHTETPFFRARRFPTSLAHSVTSSSLSRRPTVQWDTSRQSMDSVCDHAASVTFLNASSSTVFGDPFVSVIYPAKQNNAECSEDEGNSNLDTLLQRDNLGRTRIRVGGYFQDEEDGVGTLIPNDLPRSTILYVLTASEGRDKFFKCLQYGLQLMMCVLKRPTLFAPETQKLADYWAERFWRNSNTIRHGRMLFKLGRWVLNVFYLEEIIERIALKHGHAVKDVLGSLAPIIAHLRRILLSNFLVRYIVRKSFSNGEDLMRGDCARCKKSLVADDTYLHLARAELPWRDPKSTKSVLTLEDTTCKECSRDGSSTLDSTAAMSYYVKDMFYSSIYDMALRSGDAKKENGERSPAHTDGMEGHHTTVANTPTSRDVLSSPPSLQSTLPASLMVEKALQSVQRFSPTTLLCPLSRPGGEHEETCNVNGDGGLVNPPNESLSQESWGRRDDGHDVAEKTSGTSQSYLTSYQVLPYEPCLGDALPLSRSCDGAKVRTSRMRSCFEGTENEHQSALEPHQNTVTNNNLSFSSGAVSVSNSDEMTVEGDCNEAEIPLETGKPAHWRKHPLQFSTPLMLLLGVRSVATIGRRVLRDVLLLLSEKFLNLSYVENNRPILQRRTNWLWLIVACIDLLLNTIRLVNKGWYRYAKVRYSAQYRCKCEEHDDTDTVWRCRDLLARRKTDLFFPAVDLDFGAPMCSSPAYFEAADPERIAPGCRVCGCLFLENSSRAKNDGPTAGNGARPPTRREGEEEEEEEAGGNNNNRRRQECSDRTPVTTPTHTTELTTFGRRAEVVILLIPYLVRRLLNYILLFCTHPNWTATVLLQVRYMAELYLAFMYCFGGYETGKSDASLAELLHFPGAIAGLLSAVIGLHRVVQSAPA